MKTVAAPLKSVHTQRQASTSQFPLEHQLQRPPAPKVLCPCITVFLVLRKPAGNISHNSGIQTSIAASNQVQVPIKHDSYYSVSAPGCPGRGGSDRIDREMRLRSGSIVSTVTVTF